MRTWGRTLATGVALLLIGSSAGTVARAGLTPPLGVPVPPLAPSSTALGTVDREHPVRSFHGGIDNPTPFPLVNLPAPVVCAVTCAEFTFEARPAAPVLVSVKDTAGSQNDGWDLYVYDPPGNLVGAANGVGANGQALEIPVTAAGTFRIVVTFTYAYDTAASYAGEVRRMSGTSWRPRAATCPPRSHGRGCEQLPRLLAEPAAELHVDGLPPAASTPLGFPIPIAVPTTNSCYVDETVQLGATRCLRFTSDIKNVGGGRLDLRFLYDGVTCTAQQLVQRTGGSPPRARAAGTCTFHLQHAHFHYKDFVGFSLHALGVNGSIGRQVGSGLKESFCLADDDYFGFGTTGPNGPRTYAGQPGCSLPAGVHGRTLELDEGLTPGWGDVYTWDTPSQLIDISNVPPGRYALVERTNPANTILVSGPMQTCAITELTLTADSVKATKSIANAACP